MIHRTFNNGAAGGSQPNFQQYLKSEKYSTEDVNSYATLPSAVQVITTLLYACKSRNTAHLKYEVYTNRCIGNRDL